MKHLALAVLIVLSGAKAKAAFYTENNFPEKIISITVSEKGYACIGRDTLTIDQLAAELQQRLWKSYLGTGKMYDAIHLQFTGEVLTSVKDSTMDAIRKAQKKALADICLEKYKKLFEDINSRQQDKIRKQFPVLFQQDF
jgi:hypothetical protein